MTEVAISHTSIERRAEKPDTIASALFRVFVNTFDGLASVDRDIFNLVRSMGASRLSIFRHIKLPATYTPLFSALKLSATFSVTG